MVDLLLRPLSVGDYVVHGGKLTVFRIERFTTKMIVCKRAGGNRKVYKPTHFYGSDLIKVPEEDVVVWLLKSG